VLRFLNGGQTAWDDLSRRARRACVVFKDCRLPPECQPAVARIGFEIGSSGAATLYVDKGIAYRGDNDQVRAWLDAGERRFSGFDQLRNWMVGEIGPLYEPRTGDDLPAGTSSLGIGPRANQAGRQPGDLTDLDAVTSTAGVHSAAFVKENDLLRELKARVYGQDGALEIVARRISRHVGRSHPRRPATVFALGPTGVGKTRTAEVLAESLGSLLGGRWSSFVRLNMNEYQERHRVSQLLGAPPSYIGYGDGTQLIDRLVAQPESVILFDEIEKAHPDILVMLMSAMDAGELSSAAPAARGRVIDCRRAVFFFTSNIDATDAIAELDTTEDSAESVDSVCRRHLAAKGVKPELVGRIGAFLVFRSLSARARAEIATAAIARVATEYGLTVVKVAPEIVGDIVGRPYDRLGARPDEYYIDDILGSVFSQYIATGGARTIIIEAGPVPVCVPAE
jgi:Cdc48 subfamily AAA family protein